MLKEAVNKLAYAKIGIYGDAGAGKTVTASKLAVGLHKLIGGKKAVAFFDTEGASSFVKPLFDKAGIKFLVEDESRALSDLMAFMDQAEEVADIAIIDSISHVWRDAQESYLIKVNQSRKEYADRNNYKFKPITQIEFQDWRHIKGAWFKFTNRFLTSKLHCFVLGRAGTIYEYQDNERTGKKELISTGTKMATEKELGYEPSLLIEMSKIVGKDKPLINRAFVEKDRNISSPLTGKAFDFPDFEHFKSHFEFYNFGGDHLGSMEERNSSEMFTETGEDNWSAEKRQREIWCEEIKSLLVEHNLDGSSAEVKKRRNDLIKQVFDTGSWTKVENMRSEKIKEGFQELQAILGAPLSEDVPQ